MTGPGPTGKAAGPGTALVTGSAGFIGREVVGRLLAAGWQVRAMTRGGAAAFEPQAGLQEVKADMRDAASLASALSGCRAVVHLAAAKSDEPDSDEVNIGGARNLVAACRETGCDRIVNVSTQSAKIRRQGTYARTKKAADEVFESSGLRVSTLLPSVVYGESALGVFGTLVAMTRKLPVIPILGDGRWISAPVHLRDVAAAIVGALAHEISVGRRYDIGGPDLVSFDDLVDRIGAHLGLRRPKFHVPFGVSLLVAHLVSRLPRAPITVSNVLGSNQDTAIDIGPARRDLAFDPVGLEAGLRQAMAALGVESQDPLEADARMLVPYLVGRPASDALCVRYAQAVRARLGAEADAPVEAWRWVRRHPRTLPLLDAACALRDRRGELRRRVLLALAVVEATPEHAGFFLQSPPPLPWLLPQLAWQGLRAVVKTVCGLPLLWWLRRR